jgi:hypothetical protein
MNPFDKLEPKDGFRIVEHDQGGLEISLHVGLYVEGDLMEAFDRDPMNATAEIWQQKMPEAGDRGRRARAKLLAEAICRYFNAGGSWEELEDMQREMRLVVQGGLSVEGWHYFDGYVDTEGNYTHIWTDGHNVVRWVEGEYVDTGLTLFDLEREADDYEGEVHPQSEAPGAEGLRAPPGDGQPSPPALPGPSPEGG